MVVRWCSKREEGGRWAAVGGRKRVELILWGRCWECVLF